MKKELNCLESQHRVNLRRVVLGSGISNIREKLMVMNVLYQGITGALTLEAAGFVANPKTGRLEKIGWLAV
ncbi:hypothetical protein KEJ13_09545 [Candidatus Bathyarchaeota archaeon]|nr:hypothetical protein [Candidatus Bathyarchaeota archaeon]